MTPSDHLPEAVRLALQGKKAPEDLTQKEFEVWSEAFNDVMFKPSAESIAFFKDRRARGLGVGLDADGNLLYQRDVNQRDEDA